MRGPLALLALIATTPALAEPAIEIVSEPVENGYALSLIARADGAFAGRASMEIDRRGTAGTARTRQGGTLDLAPGESTIVARSHLSFGPGDTLDVVAILYDDAGREIDRKALRLD